LSYGGD